MGQHAHPSEQDGKGKKSAQTRELSILYAVAEALNSAPDERQALQRTLALMADLLGLNTGWMWLKDTDTGQFYSAAVHNLPPYLLKPVRMTGKPCWCLLSFNQGGLTPKNIDVLECSRLQPAVKGGKVDATHGLAYHASIPLYFRDMPLGILNLAAPSWRQLSKDELRLLSTIAYQVGIAVERARLAEAETQLARTQERIRIAREIHDTLAQDLTAIALNIEGALNLLESDPERARQRLESALTSSRTSLEEARRSVLGLRGGPLARPLPEALTALARSFTAETGVRVTVRAGRESVLPLAAEAELYRIAQEAMANIRRHAEATEVAVTLRQGSSGTHLTIRDNGHGFDSQQSHHGCHGLIGMRERARLIGGQLRISSRPGTGTRVTAIIPTPGQDEA